LGVRIYRRRETRRRDGDMLYSCRGHQQMRNPKLQMFQDRLDHHCPSASHTSIKRLLASLQGAEDAQQLICTRSSSGTIGVAPTPGLSTAISRRPNSFASGSTKCLISTESIIFPPSRSEEEGHKHLEERRATDCTRSGAPIVRGYHRDRRYPRMRREGWYGDR
jgi:hypothetical protein